MDRDYYAFIKVALIILLFPAICSPLIFLGKYLISRKYDDEKNRYPLISSDAGNISLAGFEIGKPIGVPECSFSKRNSVLSYDSKDERVCFSHLSRDRIGATDNQPEWVGVEGADATRHHSDASMGRPLCIGLVDGKVEAISVAEAKETVGLNPLYDAAMKKFGTNFHKKSSSRDAGDLKYVKFTVDWNFPGGGAQYLEYARYHTGFGHGSFRNITLEIFSNLARKIATPNADLMRMPCEY